MFERWIEHGLTKVLNDKGIGSIVFSPLAQGLLTNKYLNGIPKNSRAARETGFLQAEAITEPVISKVKKLNELAEKRGQKLAQMAITWVLRLSEVTSAVIGSSNVKQIEEAVESINQPGLSSEEINAIEEILHEGNV